MTTSAFRTLLLAVVAFAMVACDRPNNAARVTVNYKQVANFSEYRLAPDASGSHGAGNGMFVMYKVTQIINTGSEAAAFTFVPTKVVTVTPDETSNETVNVGNILLTNLNLASEAVAAGQTKTINKCFIKQVLTDDPQALASTSGHVPVIYQINQSQPVTMHDLAPNGNISLVLNALPNTLHQLCAAA
jgi:hypothetical protein